MKRIFSVVFVLGLAITALMAQSSTPKAVIVPGKGGIDVEKLDKSLDLNMDISNLSLYEIRVLKTALAARKGECVLVSELRSLLNATSWYTQRAIEREGWEYTEDGVVIKKVDDYTPQEREFLNKLEQAEKNLLANNMLMLGTKSQPRLCPNLDNIANPMQMT